MCKCTPEIRTPFCGRGDCLPPGYALAYEAAAAIEPHRFWDRVIPDESGCWNWSGYRNEKGYGRLKIDRRRILAHRYVDELLRGPMPAGLEIMHRETQKALL